MLSIPNQLEGAYVGQDVTLECHTEAYPASINFWTTERGEMIISGNFNYIKLVFNILFYNCMVYRTSIIYLVYTIINFQTPVCIYLKFSLIYYLYTGNIF